MKMLHNIILTQKELRREKIIKKAIESAFQLFIKDQQEEKKQEDIMILTYAVNVLNYLIQDGEYFFELIKENELVMEKCADYFIYLNYNSLKYNPQFRISLYIFLTNLSFKEKNMSYFE